MKSRKVQILCEAVENPPQSAVADRGGRLVLRNRDPQKGDVGVLGFRPVFVAGSTEILDPPGELDDPQPETDFIVCGLQFECQNGCGFPLGELSTVEVLFGEWGRGRCGVGSGYDQNGTEEQ